MTIDEAREAKAKCERAILGEITKFAQATRLDVEAVHLTQSQTLGSSHRDVLAVALEVKLTWT